MRAGAGRASTPPGSRASRLASGGSHRPYPSAWMRHPDDQAIGDWRGDEIAAIALGGEIGPGFRESLPHPWRGDYRTPVLEGELRRWADLRHRARTLPTRRRRQDALLAAEERTRLVLETMDGVGVWTYDVVGDCFHSDASFATICYGFSPEGADERRDDGRRCSRSFTPTIWPRS